MAAWQRTLDLLPEWQKTQNGEISPQKMASVIGARLLAMRPLGDPTGLDFDRYELAERFQDFARDQAAGVEEFDSLMDDLYDWADTPIDAIGANVFDAKKVCWIKTF